MIQAVSRRRLSAAILVAVALTVTAGATTASAHKVSERAAEKAAFKTVAKVAQANGAVLWYAGYCERTSKHALGCWGAAIIPDYANGAYYGCLQAVAVKAAGHKGKKRRVKARMTGEPLCEDLTEEYEQNSGGGGSGSGSGDSGEWAICGIKSSVCIGS